MPYQCDQCCKKLIIEIAHLDIVREPKLIEVSTLLDGNGRIKYGSDWEKEYMLACGEPCAMLGENNHCQIYPTRPNACVMFEAGDEYCQELRADAGLPPLVEVIGVTP